MARTRKSEIRKALDAIAARLAMSADLDGIPVIVYAQQELSSKISAAVAKVGNCILIYPARLPKGNTDRKGRTYHLVARLEVSSKPIITKADDPLADEIIEDAIAVLDGYNISPTAPIQNLLVCGDAEPVADKDFLVWGMDVTVERLPIPAPTLVS